MSDSAVEDHELSIDVHVGETLKLELAPVVVPQRANGAETDVTPVLMPIRYRVQVELQRGPDEPDIILGKGVRYERVDRGDKLPRKSLPDIDDHVRVVEAEAQCGGGSLDIVPTRPWKARRFP